MQSNTSRYIQEGEREKHNLTDGPYVSGIYISVHGMLNLQPELQISADIHKAYFAPLING